MIPPSMTRLARLPQVDCVPSAADGTYVLAVTTGMTVKINATLGDRTFLSSFNASALLVGGPISQLDFRVRCKQQALWRRKRGYSGCMPGQGWPLWAKRQCKTFERDPSPPALQTPRL